MSKLGHNFPPADELPIPEDAQIGPGWTAQMIELADHIGAYRTLLLVDRFGGQRKYIPIDPDRNPFRRLIGDAAAATISRVYGRETLPIPTARHALAAAKRRPLIAAVRSGDMSGNEAAERLGTSRSYLAELVNQRDEWDLPLKEPDRSGVLAALGRRDPRDHPEDWEAVPCRGRRGLPGQMELFEDDQDE